MEQTFWKQQKELEDLKMEVGNVYQAKSEIQRQAYRRHAHMDKKLHKRMAFNEKLHKFLEETQRVEPINYDSVFTNNSEYKKHNTLIQIRSKHYQWKKEMQIFGGMQYMILFKRILKRFVGGIQVKGCTCMGYLRWKRSCQHLNINFWFSLQNLKPHMRKKTKKILVVHDHQVQEHQRRQGTSEEGRKALNRKAIGKTYASKKKLGTKIFVVQDVSYQEDAFAITSMGERVPTKEQRILEFQQDQIEVTLDLQQ